MLEDKIVVITGASSGIGLETAKLLSLQGAKVMLIGRSESALQKASGEMDQAFSYAVDVTDSEQVNVTIKKIMDDHGRIDMLINNAGLGTFKRFEDTELSEFKAMMEVNYFGVIHCTMAILPYMRQAGHGHIINVASMAGKVATAKASGYAASKHAVLGLTQSLRHELRGSGIKVSAVSPGPVMTPFLNKADPTGGYAKRLGRMLLRPEQVAKAIILTIRTGRPEYDLPFTASIGAALYRCFPRLLEGAAHRLLNKK